MFVCKCGNFEPKSSTNNCGIQVSVCKNCGRYEPDKETMEYCKNLKEVVERTISLHAAEIANLVFDKIIQSDSDDLIKKKKKKDKENKPDMSGVVKVYHYRFVDDDYDLIKNRGITAVVKSDNRVYVSVCSKRDQFCKKKGIEVALSRPPVCNINGMRGYPSNKKMATLMRILKHARINDIHVRDYFREDDMLTVDDGYYRFGALYELC